MNCRLYALLYGACTVQKEDGKCDRASKREVLISYSETSQTGGSISRKEKGLSFRHLRNPLHRAASWPLHPGRVCGPHRCRPARG